MSTVIEHITYRHGDKQQDETVLDDEDEAWALAYRYLLLGGRVWVNGSEVKRNDFPREKSNG